MEVQVGRRHHDAGEFARTAASFILFCPPPPLHHPVSPSAGSHLPPFLAVREDLYLQALPPRARAEPGGHAAAAEPLRAAGRASVCGGRGLPVHLPGGAVPAAAASPPGRTVPVSMEIRVRKTPLPWHVLMTAGNKHPAIMWTLRLCFYFEIHPAHPFTLCYQLWLGAEIGSQLLDGWMDDGWRDGSVDGWVSGWMDRWVVRWVDGC